MTSGLKGPENINGARRNAGSGTKPPPTPSPCWAARRRERSTPSSSPSNGAGPRTTRRRSTPGARRTCAGARRRREPRARGSDRPRGRSAVTARSLVPLSWRKGRSKRPRRRARRFGDRGAGRALAGSAGLESQPSRTLWPGKRRPISSTIPALHRRRPAAGARSRVLTPAFAGQNARATRRRQEQTDNDRRLYFSAHRLALAFERKPQARLAFARRAYAPRADRPRLRALNSVVLKGCPPRSRRCSKTARSLSSRQPWPPAGAGRAACWSRGTPPFSALSTATLQTGRRR